MSKQARKQQRVHVAPPIDADVVETPAPAAVKPSLFARAKARVKTFFSRKPKVVGTGRSVWSRLWAAIQTATQTVVVKPAKVVGRFFARIGAFFARVGRRIAATRGFKVAHRLVRATLAATILVMWVTAFLANPLFTVVYSIGAYLVLEAVAAVLAKLKGLRDVDGSRVAALLLKVLNGTARAVYVGMQFVFAGLILAAMVLNPALGVLELACFGGLLYMDKQETVEYAPRWQPGTCNACSGQKLVNVSGTCRECKKGQVVEDTVPFVQDYGTHGAVMG